ncbi:ABC transporter permease [soil metagenome]
MRYIYSIVKADYLQRTRSYGFLITLAITIYAAYSFVPPPSASYTTLSIAGYKGVLNAAWVGHVSAMMTTIMLSLYGYFLINTGIKKDIDTEVGLIIATTPITNFGYLLSKFFSNFLVLLTIAGITFAVSILMFFVRNSGYPFILADFVVPYLLFALPALFVVSALAIVGEVFLGGKSIFQYLAFFMLFSIMLANIDKPSNKNKVVAIDLFGASTVTSSIKDKVNTQFHDDIKGISLGFIFSKQKPYKTFVWEGVSWTPLFMLSRLIWIAFGIALVYGSSFFFHRFDFKQPAGKKKKITAFESTEKPVFAATGISMASLPPVVNDYGIWPFIKTELLLLIRQGSKWFWLLTGGIWIGTCIAPLDIVHAYVLPVLWFLQVTRWSELATKEKTNRLHYFTWSSYKPLLRMLPAQVLAGVLIAVALALPVMLRYLFAGNIIPVINILNGSVFIVLLAVCLGIVSGGKKLFEILFFLLTYVVVEKIPVADYLGAVRHDQSGSYITVMLMITAILGTISFVVRNYQARHL